MRGCTRTLKPQMAETSAQTTIELKTRSPISELEPQHSSWGSSSRLLFQLNNHIMAPRLLLRHEESRAYAFMLLLTDDRSSDRHFLRAVAQTFSDSALSRPTSGKARLSFTNSASGVLRTRCDTCATSLCRSCKSLPDRSDPIRSSIDAIRQTRLGTISSVLTTLAVRTSGATV
jgi:hypothetical protein